MQTAKTIIFWAVIAISALVIWQIVKSGSTTPPEPEISYSDLISRISNSQVRSASIAGNVVRFRDVNGDSYRVIVPTRYQSAMLDALQEKGSQIQFHEPADSSWGTWMMNLAPLLLLAGLWFFMMRYLRKIARQRSTDPGGASPGVS